MADWSRQTYISGSAGSRTRRRASSRRASISSAWRARVSSSAPATIAPARTNASSRLRPVRPAVSDSQESAAKLAE
ncbi:hypothetical protein ACFY0A_22950 [Streptomyces sp. NPDC001698]|uniref:hypothetical protein n=1 Tax=unclassified Streptomyces TaxID=2593676 RepID=UPI00369CFFBC